MSKAKLDTTAADRQALNSIRQLDEALYRNGLLDECEVEKENELRRQVGAKPLRLERSTFDPSLLTPAPDLDPAAIRALREREGASQAVLAMHLGIATATLSQWERGLRKPEGTALKLLALIDRHGLAHVR